MFIFKAKEYQSEKSPIFDSKKSTKTARKLHIMSQLYAAKVCQLFATPGISDKKKEVQCARRIKATKQLTFDVFRSISIAGVEAYYLLS